MMLFSRTDQSIFGRWWWTVDRWLLGAIGLLIVFGIFLVMAASPAVADRIGLPSYYFTVRHLVLLLPCLALLLGISLATPRQVRLIAIVVFAVALVGVLLTIFIGVEIKGGRRWLHIPGFSIQPSEFIKPAFIVLSAWLLAHPAVRGVTLYRLAPVLLLLAVIVPLLNQPDVGMTFVVTVVWLGQLFLAGLPIWMVSLGVIAGLASLVPLYFLLPHFASRLDRFMTPGSGDSYQIDRALEAFHAGGLFGVGPGQGSVKDFIPDAHADFIFAVAGEELGLLWCLALMGLICFIVLRGFYKASQGETLFISLASAGLVMQFGIQAFINIGSSLHLLPTKGMTLPFVSYGGSSLLAMGIGMGMLLALSRRRPHTPSV